MSEQIKIRIVKGTEFQCEKRGSLLQALIQNGSAGNVAFCGGNGLCGRCLVRFVRNAPLPTQNERRYLEPEQLRKGYRLACAVRLEQLPRQVSGQISEQPDTTSWQPELVIELHFPEPTAPIVTHFNLSYAKLLEQECQLEKEDMEPYYAIVDLGSTTVVLQVVNGRTGEIVETVRFLNSQRIYGADVISRIQAAMQGHADELRTAIREQIFQGLAQLCEAVNDRESHDIHDTHEIHDSTNAHVERQPLRNVYLAGNTTMIHLLMGFPVDGLAAYPFTSYENRMLQVKWKATDEVKCSDICESQHNQYAYELTIFPGISAFVGGDIVAGMYALGFDQAENVQLLIDLGTNGEMVLGNREKCIVTSTAAGPAFENSRTMQLPGSDGIRLIADMLKQGLIDANGLLQEPYFETGYPVPESQLVITQEDIRQLQQAKAAVCAGIRMLVREYGISLTQIEHVYLAGGFGNGLDTASAVRIGLFPTELQDKVSAVANTSLAGGYLLGLQGLRNSSEQREEDVLKRLVESAQELNLALQSGFQDAYLQELNFPEE